MATMLSAQQKWSIKVLIALGCVIECIILVHNFRTEVVGHNQISAVFAPEYEQVNNIHGYDRIHRYYLEPVDYETDDEAELLKENFGNDEENEDGF